jgi:hypothetical protein
LISGIGNLITPVTFQVFRLRRKIEIDPSRLSQPDVTHPIKSQRRRVSFEMMNRRRETGV